MEYDEIIPGRLYAGKQIDAAGWKALQKLGVSSIVNLRTEPDRVPADYRWPLHEHWFRLSDTSRPQLQQLVQMVNAAIHDLNEGRVLYVHDVAGRNRLGFFLTALLMRIDRLPWHSALKRARELRPVLAPRSQFRDLLADYQRYLQIPNG